MMFRAITDEDGAYCIELSQEQAASLFPPGQGQVWDSTRRMYISIYNGDALLLTTYDELLMRDIARGAFPTVIQVDVSGTADIEFSVHGRVVQADGTGILRARVRIERVEAASRTTIASETTDADGVFDLSYPGVDASTATSTNTAFVLVADDGVSGEELARTPVIVDPEPRHHVDLLAAELTDYTGQPEYTRVLAAFEPWVSANALPNLSSDDLELLVKRTGMPADQVAMAIQAQRIAAARGIPAEASYALMRAGMPADIPGQLAQSREALRASLQSAVDNNLVDPTAFDVETVVSLYTTRKVEAVLTGSDPALVNLVATSGLPAVTTDTFLTRWVEHEGTRDEFWSGLQAGSEFSAAEVDALRFTTDSTAILNGFQPALAGIQAERANGTITTTRDLARWAASEWTTFVATHGAPDDLPGDQLEREALYAATLDRVVEEQFPTERVARRFEVAPLTETLGVPEFLDANADFDITKTVVAAYFEENPSAVPSGFDLETTEANVKRVQRVFTLTPRFHRYDVARVLMDEGIDSAASIVHIGKAGFVERFGPLLDGVHAGMSGEQTAKSVYASALQKHGFSLALMAQYGASMNTISIGAIPATTMAGDEGPGAATLASLFGSLDYCTCEHCRSMFSPAAYLVDLLSRLEALDAYTTFYGRRGDISHLELSCENTNTVLPYIDIVNEILEDAVQDPGARPTTRQTTWSEEELRLNPEPTDNDAAYDLCAAAVYPWSLPVDVPAVETREHLKRLGFTRAEAMELFAEVGANVVITQDERTAERLGMSNLEFELATQAPADGWERWGFDFSESGIWLDMLEGDVARVLEATSLSFEDLARLLTMRTVTNNFATSPLLELGPPGDNPPTCDINLLSVRGFDDRAADTIHRFLRLSRRVEASWRELDIMFEAFGGMTAAALGLVVDALQARESLGIPLDAGLWSNLDEHSYDGEPSVFARMFQSNKVLAEAAGEFSLGGPLDEAQHFAHLRSGLGINDGDLRLLLRAQGVIDEAGTLTESELDIAFASGLYARTSLATKLGLPIADLLRYLELVDFDPFATPNETLVFAEIVRKTETSKLGLNGVEYLCHHRSAPELGLHPTQPELDAVLADIAVAKADVDAQLVIQGTPVEVLRDHAEALLGSAASADRLIRGLSRQPADPWDEGVTDPALTEEGEWVHAFLQGVRTVAADPGAFLVGLPGSVGEDDFDDRYTEFAAELEQERRARGYDGAILDRLVTFSSLPQDAVAALAMELVGSPAGSSDSVHDVLFENYDEVDPPVRAAYYRTALEHFHKAAYLVSSLGIESRDLRWIFAALVPPTVGGADTMSLGDLLPVTEPVASAVAQSLFTQVRDVQLWVELLGRTTTSSEQLGSIVEEIDSTRGGLAAVSGWDEDDLDWVATGAWFALDASAIRNPARVAQLRDMALAVRRTGVRAEQLAAWARNPPDAVVSRDSKQALRARHSEASWPGVVQPISDRMRELRRDALLDYLVADQFFENREAVYAYYLLDPEMNACMMTSRLKLALSSTQLFVQRALMRLEPGVNFSPSFAREWEWRRSYRVWEANRKVFFYPENWVVPELRADKTPLFRRLEAHLQQGELTSAHVEKGFRDYVADLHDVSDLVVLDMHKAYDSESRLESLHVIARTQAEPFRYYYRKKIGQVRWTPWEPVEPGVAGEHLLLRVVKERIFLFWLEFIEDGEEGEDDSARASLRFLVSSSERRDGVWKPKRSSKPTASRAYFEAKPARYGLWGQLAEDGTMLITVFRVRNKKTHFGLSTGDYRLEDALLERQWAFEVSGCGAGGFVEGGERDLAGEVVETYDAFGVKAYQMFGQRLASIGVKVRSGETLGNVTFGWDLRPFFTTVCHQGPVPASGGGPYAVGGEMPLTLVEPVRTASESLLLQHSGWGAASRPGPDFGSEAPTGELFEPGFDAGGAEVSLLDLGSGTGSTFVFSESSSPQTGFAAIASGSVSSALAGQVGLDTGAFEPPDRVRLSLLGHPAVCDLLSALDSEGVRGVLGPEKGEMKRQALHRQVFVRYGQSADSETLGTPVGVTSFVLQPYPDAHFGFEESEAYAEYNWEVFYHAPLLVANRLRAQGRYQDAERWYRFIFDPLSSEEESSGMGERFWMTKPLFEEASSGMPDVIQAIFNHEGPGSDAQKLGGFAKSILRWTHDPFNPHAIASVRSGTYRWAAVRAYLDNLIDWADAMFRRDTIESINEATQLYQLAAAILGKKPAQAGELRVDVSTFASIESPEQFGGLAEIEGYYPEQNSIGDFDFDATPGVPISPPEPPAFGFTYAGHSGGGSSGGFSGPGELVARGVGPIGLSPEYTPSYDFAEHASPGPSGPEWWTFCLPPNPQLLEYWDVVADRMFKIRNCQNLEGAERSLALFEAPIDPDLLVRARAAGIDLGAAIEGVSASLPFYRYRSLVGRSLELCNDVRALGGALLVALEKRDGETLSKLRSLHETSLLSRMQQVREHQVDEATEQVEALVMSSAHVAQRESYYAALEEDGLLQAEEEQVTWIDRARDVRNSRKAMDKVSSVLSMAPTITTGTTGFHVSFGTQQLAAYFTFLGNSMSAGAADLDTDATLAQISAGHDRREQEWRQQKELAKLEQARIGKQIIAAEIRKAIAEKELSNHERQIERSEEVEAFYMAKYTNQELYDWMIGEVSRLYFQAYKLAFDMAKKAERAMQFELETDDTFVEFGYWDGQKKGLMAGERLHLDIKRMESAYLEKDKRELELTKRVSLRQVAPGALAQLRESGECEFEIPELLFDLDHAGHYLRRMRAVRVTMPAVAGPQTSIGATLTLLRDDLRTDASLEDTAVRTTYGGTKRIATSHAREDGGMFELNFRDERYLPFEGAGVASRWSLRLPTAVRQFDYDTITDVEIRIDYTARDGGASFRDDVEGELQASLSSALDAATENGIAMVLSAKKDFAVDWERFLRPADGQLSPVMELPITSDRFPYLLRTASLTVASVELFMVGAGSSGGDGEATLTSPSEGDLTMSFDEQSGSLGGSFDTPAAVGDQPWALNLGSAVDIDPERVDEVEDLWVIVRFNATLPSSS